MAVTIIRSMSELRTLEARWSGLIAPSPCCSWDWVQAWLSVHPEATPYVVAIQDDFGRLQAIAPWCVLREPSGLRRLTGVGGDAAAYHDPWVLDPRRSESVAAELLEACRHEQGWDVLQLILRPDRSQALTDRIHLAGWTIRENLEGKERLVVDLSHVRFERGASGGRCTWAAEEDLEGLLGRLFELHAQHGGRSDQARFHAFVRELGLRAIERDELRLAALEVEGQVQALELYVRCGDTVHALMRANAAGQGRLLTAWAYAQFAAEGIRRVEGVVPAMDRSQAEVQPALQLRQLARTSLPAQEPRPLIQPVLEDRPGLYGSYRRLRGMVPPVRIGEE